MRRNGRDAPKPAVRLSWVERVKTDPKLSLAGRETSLVREPSGSGAAQHPKAARLDLRRSGELDKLRVNSFQN